MTLLGFAAGALGLSAQDALPGTQPLRLEGDLSARMVGGISRFLAAEIAASVPARTPLWRVDFASPDAYEQSVAPNRARLAKMLGVVDPRAPNPELELVAGPGSPPLAAETDRFTAQAVRWPVLDGVWGEGLLLRPKSPVRARVVALPDADQTPEMVAGLAPGLPVAAQYARRLAENGCEVIVMTLVDRGDSFSRNPRIGRSTNQPHREWIYRQAYEMGRHVIGYELQKVLSATDWLDRQGGGSRVPIGVAGWGEGGLLAFYSAALDTRIAAAAVSGYFGPREGIWQEPIYRNVFGLLGEFGDAEITRLVVPRGLVIETARMPAVEGPPAPRAGFTGAAPGRIVTPPEAEVRAEVARARQLAGPWAEAIVTVSPTGGTEALGEPVLLRLLQALGAGESALLPAGGDSRDRRVGFDSAARQQRQVAELESFTQRLLPRSSAVREDYFWRRLAGALKSPEDWREAVRPYREVFWNEILGRFPTGGVAANPRSRRILDRPGWEAHEIVLDVLPEVFAWGYLLRPKGIPPGERRPVVVVQHGLEGLPADVINEDPASRAFAAYKAFGTRLVERGFIVFAPHNPYRGEERFRLLQRQANPLGKSLFSVIIAQHEIILDWLAAQPDVDPARIGFYGLSYGGKTAMRVPAVLERYALSICSADFNEWVHKNVSTDFPRSYMFTKEWEMPEWNLGPTFNYAEMAALIAPRPFMVERGHDDGVGIDEWVAFEYARVNRLYAKLRLPERTAIEYFPGPHTINGVGTYRFLHRHLGWPEPGR